MSADATQVTGSPLAGPGVPRPGTVLAERYELLEVIETDGPIVGYRALDQENERQVLVRVLAGPGVHTDECDRIVRHLRGLVGIGGRYLSTLLDADREGRAPFTVEAWPRGTPLSTILDARRSRGEALGAREALPVIAQLGAALRALPDGLHHGEVRAERVWLDTHGLRLTGPFLLAALPSDELGERVEKLGPGAVAYAPELRSGHSGPASDLWGVGAIAWEALTGRSPDPSGRAPEVQGKLHDTLTALLADAPERRSPSLDALLRAIAERADLSVPVLDPEPHQPPTALVDAMDGGGTEPGSAPGLATASDEHGLDPRLVRAALGVSLDIEDRTGPNDTAKLPSVSASLAESLDPRLVRAALDVSLESSSDQHALPSDSGSHGLDPRLVRAALGVEMDSAESLEMELLDDEAPAAPASSQPTLPKPTLPKPTLPKPTLPKPTLPKPARPEAAGTAEAAPPKPRVVVPNVRPFPAPGPGALRAHASDAAAASSRPVPSWPPA
ncbi:MAG: hypothetical protein KF729_35240, partial [Sandaracinaceae bacterium]|nr:hypothetical protein [Sandaracinaceae bacterium]